MAQNKPPSLHDRVQGSPQSGTGGLIEPLDDDRGRIMVYIRMTDVSSSSLNALMAAGAVLRHIAEDHRTVTAYVYSKDLDRIQNLDTVLNVFTAQKPFLNKGSRP